MIVPNEAVTALLLLGVVAAAVATLYFLFRGLRQDHSTGEYHFTWGVGIVVLFLLGLAPGFVGVGLYLTVERNYPFYWLALCVLVVVAILVVTGTALDTAVQPSAAGVPAPGIVTGPFTAG